MRAAACDPCKIMRAIPGGAEAFFAEAVARQSPILPASAGPTLVLFVRHFG